MIETIILSEPKILNVIVFNVEISIEDFTFNFLHFEVEIQVDATLAYINVQQLDIACWTLHEDHQLRLVNLETTHNPQTIKLNATLDKLVATSIETLLQECKDIFAWNYTNLKGIPLIVYCFVLHQAGHKHSTSPSSKILHEPKLYCNNQVGFG